MSGLTTVGCKSTLDNVIRLTPKVAYDRMGCERELGCFGVNLVFCSHISAPSQLQHARGATLLYQDRVHGSNLFGSLLVNPRVNGAHSLGLGTGSTKILPTTASFETHTSRWFSAVF
jgi:hypothetical protein